MNLFVVPDGSVYEIVNVQEQGPEIVNHLGIEALPIDDIGILDQINYRGEVAHRVYREHGIYHGAELLEYLGVL